MSEEVKNLWWGYRHINGNYQAKRYFDPQDIKEAKESDFVDFVYGPFEAADREFALFEVERIYNIRKNGGDRL